VKSRGSTAWAVAVWAMAIVLAGCARDSEPRAGSGAAGAPADVRSPAPRDLHPVSLPDFSNAAVSVQEQIRETYSSLMRQAENPSTPATDLAAAYGEMGKLLMAAAFGEAAESCLLNAQRLAPDDARWPYYLGHVYKEKGATAESTSSFERALHLRPDDVPTLVWLGDTYLAEDRPDLAEPKFARALRLQPRSVAALAGLGRARLARREYASAVQYLEQALALDRQAGVVHYSLAMAHRGLGDLAKAEFHLQQAGKGDIAVPDPLMQLVRGMLRSAASFESLGIQALERGDSAAAATYFRQGIELAPDSASLHHRLGTALFLAGDARGGQDEFDAALRLAPDYALAHYSLGVLMVSAGRYPEAVQRLSTAVQHDPDYVEARLLLGEVLRHTGRPDESLPHYAHVIKVDPRVAEAQLGYALALVSLGRYQQARDRLTDATTVHPDHPDLIQALARVLAAAPDPRVRDGRRAVALMQRLASQPRTPDLDEATAMAYAETGDYQQATAWQRQALAAAEHPQVQRQRTENLRLFERGEPSRMPWRDGVMP
jgi:tetratricopeptide (TPR) repeat protein